MLKVWKRSHPPSCKRSRSARLVSVSIFQNWTRTCICRRFCKASSGLGTGWHPGSDRLVVNREAPPSERLREPMGNSGEGQEKKAEAVADLLRSTSKIGRNADAVRLRIRDVGSIPIARSKTTSSGNQPKTHLCIYQRRGDGAPGQGIQL